MNRRSFVWTAVGSLATGFEIASSRVDASIGQNDSGLQRIRPRPASKELPLRAFESANFEFQPLAGGIYSAVAKPKSPAGCNAAIVVNDEGVLVVDTHLRPSAAREIIQAIRTITKQPIRYVVNSHFHNDHTQGNQAYFGVFPKGVAYLSHDNARREIIGKAMPRVRDEMKRLPDHIEELRRRAEHLTDEKEKYRLNAQIQTATVYLDELKQINITLPTITFDSSFYLHGSRPIEIHYFGRGHTAGDIVLFLPTERVLISGDLFLGPHIPYAADSYPSEWVQTLTKILQLDFDQVALGHTRVTKGEEARSQMQRLISFMSDVVAQVGQMVAASKSLAQVKASVDVAQYRSQFANWTTHADLFIERAFDEASGKLK
jgi:cyclase